jgi:hypothetical protein
MKKGIVRTASLLAMFALALLLPRLRTVSGAETPVAKTVMDDKQGSMTPLAKELEQKIWKLLDDPKPVYV